ncbi:MAG: Lrp/AsnC family transcriptional regulator [Cardiobacteriaceae bacterium]|nr:Lrp/AsnC family transcriptional regulator [Cardiobacteriaceae bacterium]
MLKNNLLDNINVRILRALQKNGRLHNNELAEEVGLSNSACLRRVKLLEDEEIIRQYVAVLEPAKVGCPLTLYVFGTFEDEDLRKRERFIFEIRLVPNILECCLMTGEHDFILKMVVADLEEFDLIKQRYLNKDTGIRNLKAEIILKTVKNTTELPLSPVRCG